MCQKKYLKHLIEQQRVKMVDAANKYGFGSEITIQHSQELDQLLNKYESIEFLNHDLDFTQIQYA